jgi:xanthine dehydrogenase accessory factor
VKRAVLEAWVRARREPRAAVLFTDLSTGESQLWRPGDPHLDPLRAEAADRALARDDAFTVAPEGAPAFFVQPHHPPLRLALVGAVHIAEALAAFARIAGYQVTIIDPREAFARRDLFPGVTVHAEWPDEVLEAMKLDHRSAVVTLTHDPKIDDPALEAALRSPAFYVGALGSGKTHGARLKRLAEKGFDAAALARIHGPVGLRIGGRTPPEVAISALAEITLRLRLGPAAPAPLAGGPGR